MAKSVFDGRMIGLSGEIVHYPKWFFLLIHNTQRALNRRARELGIEPVKIIERDRDSGLYCVLDPIRSQLGPFLSLPNYRHQNLKAFDPSFVSGKARISGRKGLEDLLELGLNVGEIRANKMKSELDISRTSVVHVERIIEETKGAQHVNR